MAKKDYDLEKDLIRTWSTYVPEEAITEVVKTMRSGWLNTGKKEKELREVACKKWGFGHCVAAITGTAALRASLAVLGIGPGDEVISTPFTFIATNTAILEQGANPVFADIKYHDLNIDPESIKKRITKKTKAIMVVHYGGNSCDMDEIREIGKKYGLPIIEDAAHALGSQYKGNYIGVKGDITCFSLQVVKIITSGDGALIATPNKSYYQQLKKVVWYGMDKEDKTTNLLDPLPKSFRGDKLGFKYNMNDITATIGLAGVNNYDVPATRRKEIGECYRQEFSRLPNLKLLEYYEDRKPNYQIFPVHVKNRLAFAKYLRAKGIMVNVNNRRNDIYPMFGGKRSDLPNTARADRDVIVLPIHTNITNRQINYIVEHVTKAAKG